MDSTSQSTLCEYNLDVCHQQGVENPCHGISESQMEDQQQMMYDNQHLISFVLAQHQPI